MKQEAGKPTELQRFDKLTDQLKEYKSEVKYGMGASETPSVQVGAEQIAFGLYMPKDTELLYSPCIYELEHAWQNYVRRSDLDEGAYKVRAEKALRALPILEQKVAEYVEVVSLRATV